MKRILACVAALILLTGCRLGSPQDEITLKPLNEDQKDVLSYLDSQNTLLLFEYATEKPYQYVKFWVDVYQNGELVEPELAKMESMSDSSVAQKGKVALHIRRDPDYHWTFTDDSSNGVFAKGGTGVSKLYHEGSGYSGVSNETHKIEEDQVMLLYSTLFGDPEKSTVTYYMEQEYLDHPELLKEYSYAHLVKCCFSNHPID